jgi:hypothetical protein
VPPQRRRYDRDPGLRAGIGPTGLPRTSGRPPLARARFSFDRVLRVAGESPDLAAAVAFPFTTGMPLARAPTGHIAARDPNLGALHLGPFQAERVVSTPVATLHPAVIVGIAIGPRRKVDRFRVGGQAPELRVVA